MSRYRGPRDCAICNDLPGHSKFEEDPSHIFLLTVVSLVLTIYSTWPREGIHELGIHELTNVARIVFVWCGGLMGKETESAGRDR